MLSLLVVSTACGDEFSAAGVLPYHPKDGTVWVLLGLDSHRSSWADFVGWREDDESVVDTAVRELAEETRGAYPPSETRPRLAESDPYVVGRARIFLLEVPFIPSDELENLPRTPDFEKTRYCWIRLDDLLRSIDSAARDSAKVPPYCGDEPRVLFELFRDNLAAGGVLRRPLEELQESARSEVQ